MGSRNVTSLQRLQVVLHLRAQLGAEFPWLSKAVKCPIFVLFCFAVVVELIPAVVKWIAWSLSESGLSH